MQVRFGPTVALPPAGPPRPAGLTAAAGPRLPGHRRQTTLAPPPSRLPRLPTYGRRQTVGPLRSHRRSASVGPPRPADPPAAAGLHRSRQFERRQIASARRPGKRPGPSGTRRPRGRGALAVVSRTGWTLDQWPTPSRPTTDAASTDAASTNAVSIDARSLEVASPYRRRLVRPSPRSTDDRRCLD